MGEYGLQTSITAATMSGHGVAYFATIWCYKLVKGNGKAIPLQAWTGPEGSRRLKLPDFKTIGTYKLVWQHNCNIVIIAIIRRKFLGLSLHLLHIVISPFQTYFSVLSSRHLALIVTQMLAMITCISNKCFGLDEPVQWGWSRQRAGSLECHHLHCPWYFSCGHSMQPISVLRQV